jgi:hypothetical protein
MFKDSKITHKRLLEVVRYEPLTGEFIPLDDKVNHYPHPKGYNIIYIDSKNYRACRLAYFYMMGEWPPCDVDHIDTDVKNDRWNNLRLADKSQQACNRNVSKNNIAGIKGFYHNKKYKRIEVSVEKEGKKYRTTFSENKKEEAVAWLRAKREELHGEFTNHG